MSITDTSFDFTPAVDGQPVDPTAQGGQVLGATLWPGPAPHDGQQFVAQIPVGVRRADTTLPTWTFDTGSTTGTVWATVSWSQSAASPVQAEDLTEPILLLPQPYQRSALLGLSGPWAPWVAPADLIAAHSGLAAVDPGRLQDDCALASEILWSLSGQRFDGVRTAVVRPVIHGHGWCRWGGLGGYLDWLAGEYDGADLTPIFDGYGLAGVLPGACGSSWRQEIPLEAPLIEVLRVVEDGAELEQDVDYRVDDYRVLRRLNGQAWPACQRLDLPTTQVGTLEVTYAFGSVVPAGGVAAARVLAAAFAFEDSPSPTTQAAPQRTTSVSRRGVTQLMKDASSMIEKGFTGIPRVDMWIRAVNPSAISRAATFHSPDGPRLVRTDT